ncbi:hypothetical protein [Sinomonas mesophila]|uniref:hypothetical protein n=1 Tax=Sinomonas mesophila TaxID=1531955 RepID=UPI001589C32C|nr:hypothetical protein [Sinomonas mesophila]
MKRRTPRSSGFPAPVSPRPGAATPLPGQAQDVDSHERLIRKLDIAVLLEELL